PYNARLGQIRFPMSNREAPRLASGSDKDIRPTPTQRRDSTTHSTEASHEKWNSRFAGGPGDRRRRRARARLLSAGVLSAAPRLSDADADGADADGAHADGAGAHADGADALAARASGDAPGIWPALLSHRGTQARAARLAAPCRRDSQRAGHERQR